MVGCKSVNNGISLNTSSTLLREDVPSLHDLVVSSTKNSGLRLYGTGQSIHYHIVSLNNTMYMVSFMKHMIYINIKTVKVIITVYIKLAVKKLVSYHCDTKHVFFMHYFEVLKISV